MFTVKDTMIFLLALVGSACFVISWFCLIIKYQSQERKNCIFMIEFSTSMLLFMDMLAYIYRGNSSQLGFWMVRITNFLVYLSIYAELFSLNKYLETFVREKNEPIYKHIKAGYALTYLGVILVVVSQFTGMYYSFDAENYYRRGPLFLLCYMMPLLIYAAVLTTIIQKRHIFPKMIFTSLMMFAILPALGAFLQAFFYGTSFMNLAIGICAIAMFAFSLIDQNFYLMKMASEEIMTGLPNSHGFMMAINEKARLQQLPNYNAFYFDIVRMGLINRKYGTAVGDEVIKKYASMLRGVMQEDEVLGRLGGNFFVALVRKENTEEFLQMLGGVEIVVETMYGSEKLVLSSVAGVYEIESNHIEPAQILNNIGMAVNIAKNIQKRPYVFLTIELQGKMNEQRQVQEMLPKCMAKRELKPYYQPKVNTKNNTLCGAEALVRWEHEGELIPPYRFVPLMEQNEFICKFDFYMLDYVCTDIREWIDKGLTPPVISVNFSRRNLGNANLAEEMYRVVRRHNIPPHLIQIEITETMDEYPLSYLKGVVEAIQRYGMSAAIDDFGTGSSSIQVLKEVPFNVLKIDKSFIDSTTPKDRKILGYIISMAHSLNAGVITEGVEKEEQIEILEELGCTEIQGYYFDKPLPKTVFEERISHPVYDMHARMKEA